MRGDGRLESSPRKRTEGMSSFLFVDDVSTAICLRFRTAEVVGLSREEKEDGDSGDIIASAWLSNKTLRALLK